MKETNKKIHIFFQIGELPTSAVGDMCRILGSHFFVIKLVTIILLSSNFSLNYLSNGILYDYILQRVIKF